MKNTTITLSLYKFVEYTELEYYEDIYSAGLINYDHTALFKNAADLVELLPKGYNKIKSDVLNRLPELKGELDDIINLAYEDSLYTECYKEQEKHLMQRVDETVDYINKVEADVINYIKVDIAKEKVYINVQPTNALKAILEIINGEGTFAYADVDELMITHSPRKSAIKTINETIHYLLNLDLIAKIYGFRNKPTMNWTVNDWPLLDAAMLYQINQMTKPANKLLSGLISTNTYSAIVNTKKIAEMKDETKHLTKLTKQLVKEIPKKELTFFNKQIKALST